LAASILDSSLEDLWHSFKSLHKKKYASTHEETRRRAIWESNHKHINKHNEEHLLGKHSFSLKMNKYGDMVYKLAFFLFLVLI
jgi:cathepsin L